MATVENVRFWTPTLCRLKRIQNLIRLTSFDDAGGHVVTIADTAVITVGDDRRQCTTYAYCRIFAWVIIVVIGFPLITDSRRDVFFFFLAFMIFRNFEIRKTTVTLTTDY